MYNTKSKLKGNENDQAKKDPAATKSISGGAASSEVQLGKSAATYKSLPAKTSIKTPQTPQTSLKRVSSEFEKTLEQIRNNEITKLDLSLRGIGDIGARKLAEALKENRSLTSLDLGMNNIGEGGARALAEALKVNNSLTSLDLEKNNIGDEGVKSLAEALKENSSLTRLNLTGNKIEDKGASELTEALKENLSLTFLHLMGNKIGEELKNEIYDKVSLNNLNPTLEQIRNNEITELDLKFKCIGDEEARFLAEALKQNTSLTSLNLGVNDIEDGGVRSLAEALRVNSSLTSLVLRMNNIGKEGANALAEALKENSSLAALDLRFNNLGEETRKKIENYARDRSALKEQEVESSIMGLTEESESKIEKESKISKDESDIVAQAPQKPATLEESSYSQPVSFPLSSEVELTTPALSKGEDTMEASNSGGRQLTDSSATDNSAGSLENNELESELQDTIQHVKFILNYLGDYEQKQAVASYVYMNLEGIKVKGGIEYYHKVLDERFSSEEKEKLEELKPHLERAMRESAKSFEELYQSLKGVVKDKLERMIEKEKIEKEKVENREASIQEKIDEVQKTREQKENELHNEHEKTSRQESERKELLEQIKVKFKGWSSEFEKLKNEFEKLTDSSEATEIFNQFKNLEAKIPPWVFKNSKFLEENSLPRIDTIISEIYQLKIVKELSDFKQIKTNIKEIKDSAQILKQYAHNSDTQEEKTLMQKHLAELEQIVPKFMWLNIGVDSEDSSEQYQISEKDFELTPIGEEQGEYSE